MKKCCNDFLMEQFGDTSVVNEIYEEYAKSMSEKITEGEAALNSEDWTELEHMAHAVKGNALAVGSKGSFLPLALFRFLTLLTSLLAVKGRGGANKICRLRYSSTVLDKEGGSPIIAYHEIGRAHV